MHVVAARPQAGGCLSAGCTCLLLGARRCRLRHSRGHAHGPGDGRGIAFSGAFRASRVGHVDPGLHPDRDCHCRAVGFAGNQRGGFTARLHACAGDSGDGVGRCLPAGGYSALVLSNDRASNCRACLLSRALGDRSPGDPGYFGRAGRHGNHGSVLRLNSRPQWFRRMESDAVCAGLSVSDLHGVCQRELRSWHAVARVERTAELEAQSGSRGVESAGCRCALSAWAHLRATAKLCGSSGEF